MNDTVNLWVLGKYFIQLLLIRNVTLVVLRALARDQLDAIDAFFRGIVEVVNNDDVVVSLEKSDDGE